MSRGKRFVWHEGVEYAIPGERDDEWDDLQDYGFEDGIPEWAERVEPDCG